MGNTSNTPKAESTPLDGLSNEQLLAMLTPIQKERAEALSLKLGTAAKEITKIAEYLRARASGGLNWKGAASESFVEWTGATASATFYLAEYTELASKCLAESAQAMAEAKSGVDGIAKTIADAETDYKKAQRYRDAAQHDPGAGKDAVQTFSDDMEAAVSARKKARIEALMKLRSLGQTYTHTGQRVNSAPRPEFPAPSTMNDEWVAPKGYMQVPGSSSSSRMSSTTGGYEPAGRASSTGSSEGSVVGGVDSGTVRPGEPTRPATVLPDPVVDMEIDGGLTLPDAPTTPSTTPPGTTTPQRPDTITYPGGTTQVPPPLTGGSGKTFPTGPGTGKVGPTMRGMPGPGTVAPTHPTSRMPQTGIVGGRQVPQNNGRPQVGLPRSPVIGHENTHARGPMGAGAHPMGGGPGQGNGNGYPAGRRLATETGGVVGGRAQQSGQASARPFTPGGSGLVRGAQAGAGAGAGAAQGRAVGAPLHGAGARTGDSRSDDSNGERPDYLTEDEETWQQGARRIVPPVVD